MRTIFLLAKFLAHQNSDEKITMDHIKKAILGVEFIDEKAKNIILLEIGLDHYDVAQLYSNQEISSAEAQAKKDFDEQVKEFKVKLEKEGFTLHSTVSKVYADKKNSLNEIMAKVNKVQEALQNKVFGQNQAIDMICDKLVETTYKINTNGPKAIFFFLGPPATGKTMLAQLLVEELEDYTDFKQFDMTQYTSANEGFGLFGLTKGFSEAAEGRLTSFVKKNPKSVLVFDEIEKAHSGVHSNFLSLLATGKAVDGFTEEEIDFTQTIVVFTSNIGSELYNNQNFIDQMSTDMNTAQSTILEALSRETKIVQGQEVKAITPELLSRLAQGELILFNKLPFNAFVNMAKKEFINVQESFENAFALPIVHDDFTETIALNILSYAPMVDARRIKSKLPLGILDKITDHLRQSDTIFESIRITLSKDAKKYLKDKIFSQNEQKQNSFMRSLFRKNETIKFQYKITEKGSVLELIFKNIEQVKLPKSVDYGEDGGLVFEVPSISFENIAGHHVAKSRLNEVIEILKNPSRLEKFNIDIPKGMLLYGPPGTGKTMLAQAFANEADLPFISTTGTELFNIDLMKKIFKRAREYAPSIVFIDEIDAVGSREDGTGRELVINSLLTEINGFGDNADEAIFIIAATNLKDRIDPAIVRSGRIDLHVEIDELDRDARAYFIANMLKKPTSGTFDKDKLIMYTAGMTGADLEKVSRESSLYAIRNGLATLTEEILVEQINTIKYGERINSKSIAETLKETAYHEAGHAVISRVLMPEIKIEQITVAPRNDALGFVSFNNEDSFGGMSREHFKNRMCVAMAGRIAQMREFGEAGMDTGASNDLKQATKYAYYAVAILGMDDELGYINIGGLSGAHAGLFNESIERAIKNWLDEAKQCTEKLVEEHWSSIDKLGKLLLDKEIVYEDDLKRIIN
ncbi:MAG: AAA family ATPase [Sulfuricurvum sp.]|nr:AAA family ATPase [Sulfuricurvum sp.]